MADVASTVDRIAHKFIDTNGIKLHYVETGSGPTVLLLHGFPDYWYGYRYQIPALAAAGFHVVVPDLRGFGESGVPESVDQYTSPYVVGDIIGLFDLLQVNKALVVGHDWGSQYAADLCLMRPDRVKAVVFLSVPYIPVNPKASIVDFMMMAGDQVYINVFQKPGHAEALFANSRTANVLKGFFLRWHLCSQLELPRFFTDGDDAEALPEWLTQKDVKYYAETFDRSGFTGGFNHYRAMAKNSELKKPWAYAKIHTPSMTVLARKDLTLMMPGMLEITHPDNMKKNLPNHQKCVVLEDAGHFMHQEKHEEVNKLLLNFLEQFKD